MADDRIKRPAYQWYVADAENDEVFLLMTYEQQGIYRRLLDRQWIEGSIPADPKLIFALLPKLKSYDRFLSLWTLISVKFQAVGEGRLVNARLEAQRMELDLYIQEQRKRGQLGGRRKADRLAVARAGLAPSPQPDGGSSSSSSSSSSSASENTESPAASAVPSPAVLEFPTIGVQGPIWCLTEAQVADWQAAYPSMDILAEARKALAWVRADTGRRKTAGGMSRFLVSWLNRAADRGGFAKGAAPKSGRHDQWLGTNKGAEIADV